MRFEGTSAYVATDDLKVAVNAAIALERPLLVKGEPGTGKTVLAIEIAKALGAPLIEWHIKSTTKAQQGLYEYDAVTRLRDSQLGDARVKDIRNYIRRGKLWEAFVADERPVLLIDEIDKADIEFPNDLLQELDRMEFFVYETGETIQARRRPIVVITSNNEKELPDAFLRRCFFHYIRFPDPDTMRAIVEVHFPGIKQRLVAEALKLFYEIRDVPGMKKKPSTSELLDWLKLLMVEDVSVETLRERDPKKLIPPLHGALIKNEQDIHLFERLGVHDQARRTLVGHSSKPPCQGLGFACVHQKLLIWRSKKGTVILKRSGQRLIRRVVAAGFLVGSTLLVATSCQGTVLAERDAMRRASIPAQPDDRVKACTAVIEAGGDVIEDRKCALQSRNVVAVPGAILIAPSPTTTKR